MAHRNPHDQSLHDRVIDAAIGYLNTTEYDIYQNPGSFKNAGIANNYPDIIMTKKDDKTVEFIIEVETKESITLSEASNQWKKYFTEITATFYLLVPFESKNVTLNLCRQLGITVRIGTYKVGFNGNIVDILFE